MKTKSTLFCLVIAVCTNTCITVYAQAVNKQDSLALVDLYNSTNGPAWNYNTNWLTGPVKTWLGISVTGTRVTGIDLSGNNLNGSIPASLGNLVNLTTLDLGLYDDDGIYNHLTGSIPSSLGNLVNLTTLDLHGNQLSGSIPSSIGNLINLTSLDLSYNQLSSSIPASISNLENLTFLILRGNQLSGSIPSSLGNLVNLQVLWSVERKYSIFSWQSCKSSSFMVI
jgi:Leucine-rich repeat (LRR) protein